MREFRFKLLLEDEKLCCFTGSELVVKTPEGSYKIYRVEGFNEGRPNFYRKANAVQVLDLDEIPCSILCRKLAGEYWISKIKVSPEGAVEIEGDFVVVVKRGIGKLEIYDADQRVTVSLPAMEDE